MASNQGNQGGSQNRGGSSGSGSGQDRASSGRGFAGMDDERQREIAQQGGEASAREQGRDNQGQFKGTAGSQGNSGSRSQGGGSGNSGSRSQGGGSGNSQGGSSKR